MTGWHTSSIVFLATNWNFPYFRFSAYSYHIILSEIKICNNSNKCILMRFFTIYNLTRAVLWKLWNQRIIIIIVYITEFESFLVSLSKQNFFLESNIKCDGECIVLRHKDLHNSLLFRLGELVNELTKIQKCFQAIALCFII